MTCIPIVLCNIFSRPIGDRGFAWSIRETDLSPRPRTRWLTAEMGGPDGNGVTFGFFFRFGLRYFCFASDPIWAARSAASERVSDISGIFECGCLTKDEVRRMAVNVAKLPDSMSRFCERERHILERLVMFDPGDGPVCREAWRSHSLGCGARAPNSSRKLVSSPFAQLRRMRCSKL